MKEVVPINVAVTQGNYAHAVCVPAAARHVYISGQIPVDAAGNVPTGFEAQADQVWRNIENILAAEGMAFTNLAKVTTFLSRREFADANGAVRRRFLGSHRPALTVIIAEIYDPNWLLEIEAVAVG